MSGQAAGVRHVETVVIVGAGIAGVRTAEQLRAAGYTGAITLVGAETGLPYDRPPLSKQVLSGEWPLERTTLLDEGRRGDLGIDLRRGAVATAARHGCVVLADGSELPFDALVVATGVTPNSLPGVQTQDRVHLLRTSEDCVRLCASLAASSSLAVVGAGFIGAEVAATARSAGLDVTLIDTMPHVLGRALGSEIGALCGELHRDNGVDVRMSSPIESLSRSDAAVSIRLADGTLVRADTALIGVGSRPNTAWLADSGIDVTDGVRCDDHGQVLGRPDVFAVGDVAAWRDPLTGRHTRREHWTSATEQATTVARRVVGLPPVGETPVPYFWSDQYGIKIQVLGRPELATSVEFIRRPDGALRGTFAAYVRDGAIVGVVGFGAAKLLNQSRALVERCAPLGELLGACVA